MANHLAMNLHSAFVAGDRSRVVQLFHYPLRVNTRSRCTALIDGADALMLQYKLVFSGKVQEALRAPNPRVHARVDKFFLGRGDIWIEQTLSSVGATVINSDVWRLVGFPCDGEPDRPLPADVDGEWQVASVAILQGGQLVPRSPKSWLGRSLILNLSGGEARVQLRAGGGKTCTIGRSAQWDAENYGSLGAPRVVSSRATEPSFLDLVCGTGARRYVERVDVLGNDALAVVGDDKYLLILKRTSAAPLRIVEPGQPCGGARDRCGAGYVCTADPGSSEVLNEICREIE